MPNTQNTPSYRRTKMSARVFEKIWKREIAVPQKWKNHVVIGENDLGIPQVEFSGIEVDDHLSPKQNETPLDALVLSPIRSFLPFQLIPSATPQQCLRPAAQIQHDPRFIISAFDRCCGEVQVSVSLGWKRFQVVFSANIRQNGAIRGQQDGDTAAALRLGL